jgi:hypothetical protein
MVDYVPTEKGMTIREPSTANLMIDALDRNQVGNPGSFTIQKKSAILNGFFTRIGVTEVVLDWGIPNISSYYSNNTFTVTVLGVQLTATVPDGQYTVEQVLKNITTTLTAFGTYTFAIVYTNGIVYLKCTVTAGGASQNFTINQTYLADQLGFNQNAVGNNFGVGSANVVDLRWWRYLDFTSADLTYPQDVKDGMTSDNTRNVLCRFYLEWDNPPQNDAYGFPILFGYQFCCCRRIFSPAKQIKWEPNLPIGNLSFQVFGVTGPIGFPALVQYLQVSPPNISNIASNFNWNWLMTLQVSEV